MIKLTRKGITKIYGKKEDFCDLNNLPNAIKFKLGVLSEVKRSTEEKV